MISTLKNEAASDEVSIFYVDDDRDDLEVFTAIIAELDQQLSIYTLNDGDKVLHALENPPPAPSVLFLDLNMPGKDGFEVLQEIREGKGRRDLPVVIMSTSDDERIISRCYNMGASFYITKANDYIELKKSIVYALAINWNNFKPTAQEFLYKN